MTLGRGALSGVKVVEVAANVASAYCGALLMACGADVVKIEPPAGGDPVRHLPPFTPGVDAPEAGGMHLFLNANKRSVVLDLSDPSDRATAGQLAASADIVLGGEEAVTLGGDVDGLIRVALSWFGLTGPRRDWRGTDAVIQALTGFIYTIGPTEGPPIIPGGYNAQITGGLTAYIAATGALIGRQTSGRGCTIDQSVFEAYSTYTEISPVKFRMDGELSVRKGVNRFNPTYPQTIYPCRNGTWLGVTTVTPAQWYAACDLIGVPDFARDPRFQTSQERNDLAHEIDPVFIRQLASREAAEWFHAGQQRKIPFALVPTMAELADLDHFQARAVLADYDRPGGGTFSAPVVPWHFQTTPVRRGGAAPRLGQHTAEVLAELSGGARLAAGGVA